MLVIDIIIQRVREIREFILLPWDEKKRKMKEYWDKYWRIYLFLFIFAAIIALINSYIDWQSSTKRPSTKSLTGGGVGDDDDKNKQIASNKNIAADAKEPSKNAASNTTNVPTEEAGGAAANNQSKKEELTLGSNNESKPPKPSANNSTTEQTNKTVINVRQTKNIINNIDNTTTDTIPDGKTAKQAVRERRLASQASRPPTNISNTLSEVGNSMSSALNGGVGKALSVIGMFFSAIIGLFLFCSAPVVLFYMWMKKLIMPLFPTK